MPLELLWRAGSDAGQPLAYPRSLQWSPDGERLLVADVKSGQIVVFDRDGGRVRPPDIPASTHPYLAGWRADSLVVFDPDAHRFHYVGETGGRSLEVDAADDLLRAYLYAAHTDAGPVVKVVRRDRPTRLLHVGDTGSFNRVDTLSGPYWRHAGFLRTWGDTLLSLCGYRPVVDLVTARSTDTLALRGFDSPMLSRSLLFARGEVDQPPLLYASAAAAGPYLFVLNLRPGWPRVDIYDRSGVLQRVLTDQADLNPNYYPVDIAVYQDDEQYLIALAVAQPAPRIDVYKWRPVEGAGPAPLGE